MYFVGRLRNSRWFSDIARRHLAEAYKKQGRTPEGFESDFLLRPRPPEMDFSGGLPIYEDAKYNQIMKSVAEQHSIEIIDAASALDEYPSVYLDFCHPDQRGHRRIAERLHECLGDLP